MKRLQDIQMRDPFIVPDEKRRLYYLYGTTDTDPWYAEGEGFDCYWSEDLQNWDGPFPAFRPPRGFWGFRHFWAPKVHLYKGRYYMFAAFQPRHGHKGVAVLTADSLPGPFVPHSYGPVTPSDWECLDGTLHVDDDGQPWLVFCHEWVQVGDGEICAMRLASDLKKSVAAPALVFRASAARWTVALDEAGSRVTNGPFPFRTRGGKLLMLWSGTWLRGCAMGISRSDRGLVVGKWFHERKPICVAGSNGMLFQRFDGQFLIVCHYPNHASEERAIFMSMRETDSGIAVSDAPDIDAGDGRESGSEP